MKALLIGFLLLGLASAQAAVESGEKAPNFSLKNEEGKSIDLSDYKGKTVVLEWYNKDCPFVKKHYESKNMQNLQSKWTGKDVVWLSIISSAEGKQGYLTESEAKANKKSSGSGATAVLLDPSGKVGKMYDAKTTPHMYVISKTGELLYQGAIDSNSSYDPSVIPSSKNYVDEVLSKLASGEKVKPGRTQAYGCSVKY
ncbi:MAG: redoxin domain-containing protein [Deltaproteobacteria bacterium]|nr:MAG: redoxin domain-containing protein [Deltaproteobacteria bacterium]